MPRSKTGKKLVYPNGDKIKSAIEDVKNGMKISKAARKHELSKATVLLIMDNDESHCQLSVIEFAKQNGIVLLTLPPHTTHKLQPLDRSVFGPFKQYYNKAARDWMLSNPGKTINIYDVAELIGVAYPKAFNNGNIVSGFKATGIYPLNSNIFDESDLSSSFVTDSPSTLLLCDSDENNVCANQLSSSKENINNCKKNPEQSTLKQVSPHVQNEEPSTSKKVPPEEIRPFPKAETRKTKRRGRKIGKTRILTNSPEIDLIKQRKVSSAPNSKPQNNSRRRNNPRKSKKKLDFSLINSDDSDFSANSGECYSPKTSNKK